MIRYFSNRETNPIPVSALVEYTPYQLWEIYLNIPRNAETKHYEVEVNENPIVSNRQRFFEYHKSIGMPERLIQSEWIKERGKTQKQSE